jgi:peptidoglycan/LPS O-acetylase OafA/YrhL
MTQAELNADAPSVNTTTIHQGRIPSLDGLRAVAVVLVLLTHLSQTNGFIDKPLLRHVHIQGAIGVEVFFVISGFLITTLMLREVAIYGRLSISQFYFRRVLRIAPAYLVFAFTVLLMDWSGYVHISGGQWLAVFTYTVNFWRHPVWIIGHIWSLSIEEHFYLFWPLVFVLGGLRGARGTAIFLIGFCFIARWIILLAFPRWTQMAELWTFTRLDTIAFGCLLAMISWDARWRSRLERLCASNVIVTAIFAFVVVSVLVFSRSGKYSVGMAYTLNAVCITLLIWAAVRRPMSNIGRVLNHPAIASVGALSYSLYLWQQIFLDPDRNDVITRFPQNILFAIAAAVCCHIAVEKPFLRLKQRTRRELVPAETVMATQVPSQVQSRD